MSEVLKIGLPIILELAAIGFFIAVAMLLAGVVAGVL